jgi:transcription termination/antitermination protein NusG
MMTENWYALRVKSRHEFVTSEELTRKKIENFLPSVLRVRQWKDRKKTVDFPLFPGYLFVHIEPQPGAFLNVLKTRGSVNFVSLEPGQPTSVSPVEIAALSAMLKSGEQLDVFPAFKEGAAVRVKHGPLRGTVGILAKREDRHMFLINIDILGRSVGLKICAEDVELA